MDEKTLNDMKNNIQYLKEEVAVIEWEIETIKKVFNPHRPACKLQNQNNDKISQKKMEKAIQALIEIAAMTHSE